MQDPLIILLRESSWNLQKNPLYYLHSQWALITLKERKEKKEKKKETPQKLLHHDLSIKK